MQGAPDSTPGGQSSFYETQGYSSLNWITCPSVVALLRASGELCQQILIDMGCTDLVIARHRTRLHHSVSLNRVVRAPFYQGVTHPGMFIFGEVVPCHDNNTHDAAQDWYQRYTGIQIISATLMDEWREVANC